MALTSTLGAMRRRMNVRPRGVPAPTPATGAIAGPPGPAPGTPGTWTPVGSIPPKNLVDIQNDVPVKVTASPSSLWVNNQHMVTTSGTTTWWDGAAWRSGKAREVVAEQQPIIEEEP